MFLSDNSSRWDCVNVLLLGFRHSLQQVLTHVLGRAKCTFTPFIDIWTHCPRLYLWSKCHDTLFVCLFYLDNKTDSDGIWWPNVIHSITRHKCSPCSLTSQNNQQLLGPITLLVLYVDMYVCMYQLFVMKSY